MVGKDQFLVGFLRLCIVDILGLFHHHNHKNLVNRLHRRDHGPNDRFLRMLRSIRLVEVSCMFRRSRMVVFDIFCLFCSMYMDLQQNFLDNTVDNVEPNVGMVLVGIDGFFGSIVGKFACTNDNNNCTNVDNNLHNKLVVDKMDGILVVGQMIQSSLVRISYDAYDDDGGRSFDVLGTF